MRPRIRTIKPEFFSDSQLQTISVGSRYVAIGLMSAADDRGRLQRMIPQLRGYIFPNGDITEKQFEKALTDIEEVRFAWCYVVGPFSYLWLPRFWKHQRINRPSESSLPPDPHDPYGGLPVDEAMAQFKEDSLNGHDLLTESSVSNHGSLTPSRAGPRSVPFLSSLQTSTERSQGVREAFDYWREKCRHPDAVLDAKRRSAISGRLREGRTLEQIRLAIDGAAKNPYVNESGKRFDDIELICRNASKLEDFIDRSKANVLPIKGRSNASDMLRRLDEADAAEQGLGSAG